MPVSREGGEARGSDRGLVDRRVVDFLKVAQQPSRSYARVPARIIAGDQDRELERVLEAERRQLLRRRFGDEQVLALDCAAEDRVGTALRGRLRSSRGPRRCPGV